jgi:phage tail-like protein
MTDTERTSSYWRYLPALFQETDHENGNFLNGLLLAFEDVLTGKGDVAAPGLAELLDGVYDRAGNRRQAGIERYFEPGPERPQSERAPREFLHWLAGWVALSLREDWSEDEQRRFIARINEVYRLRGTRTGMIELLRTYTGGLKVEIYEFAELPHYFQVEMFLNMRDQDELRRKERIARAIIEQEKPAHTFYTLKTRVPTMRIGYVSTVGVDTLLGTPEEGEDQPEEDPTPTTPTIQIGHRSTVGVDTTLGTSEEG